MKKAILLISAVMLVIFIGCSNEDQTGSPVERKEVDSKIYEGIITSAEGKIASEISIVRCRYGENNSEMDVIMNSIRATGLQLKVGNRIYFKKTWVWHNDIPNQSRGGSHLGIFIPNIDTAATEVIKAN